MSIQQSVKDFLLSGVTGGIFTGAQAAWFSAEGATSGQACAGRTKKANGKTIDPKTLFDIASITKAFTVSAVLRLVEKGVLSLDARLEENTKSTRGTATLEELLAHEAGFTAWLPLFEDIKETKRGTKEARRAIMERALSHPGGYDPGKQALYSDLGFIVLARIVEDATGLPLDRLIADQVCGPLELESVHFIPVSTRPVADANIVATEQCPWRGRVLIGEVHDDNAWTMGGISGHAGLFATAEDVARLGVAWLHALEYGGWLSRELAGFAVSRRPLGRGLGWDLVSAENSSAGRYFSKRGFGHLGFTGCSLWVDPGRGLSVALNTNRVHFGRDNSTIRQFRPAFHDRLIELLEQT